MSLYQHTVVFSLLCLLCLLWLLCFFQTPIYESIKVNTFCATLISCLGNWCSPIHSLNQQQVKFFATSMYRLYSMPFSFSCLFSHFNWSKIASHAIFALFLFTFCWGLPSLLLHTCGIIVYFSFKLFQIVLFSANVSDWSVSKICIKYRKHENPSFSHTFNCVCQHLFLGCPKSC